MNKPSIDCEMTAALSKLHDFLSIYTSNGEKVLGESSILDFNKIDYPLLHSNIGTNTTLKIHITKGANETVMFLQSTKGYYSSFIDSGNKSCTIKIHDYSIQAFGTEVRIRDSLHRTDIPLDDFIDMSADDIYQYCTMYKDFEILHNMFLYSLDYDIYLNLPFDCIKEYGEILEKECKRHGWI